MRADRPFSGQGIGPEQGQPHVSGTSFGEQRQETAEQKAERLLKVESAPGLTASPD